MLKKVLSLDIGIINLGYVYSEITVTNDNFRPIANKVINYNIEVLSCDKVDITDVKHSIVCRSICKLFHDNCIPDYIDHFIQENQEMFDECDTILIERQPITGITNVQDLIFSKFRNKSILVSPNTIHKHFYMSRDYSVRKIESQQIAKKYLSSNINWINNIRKHDISDALLLLLYHYHQLCKKEYSQLNTTVDFEEFRYTPIQNNLQNNYLQENSLSLLSK